MSKVIVYKGPGERGGTGERIFIKTEFANRPLCKQIPSYRWHPEEKVWHYPATVATVQRILEVFAGKELVPDVGVSEMMRQASRAADAQRFKDATDNLPRPPVRTEAWLHQRRAFAFGSNLPATMLAMDMGTGKSLVSIALAQFHQAKRVLILCPVSVIGVWPKQFATHAIDPEEWHIVAPSNKSAVRDRAIRIAAELRYAEARRQSVVVIINYESAWRPAMAELLKNVAWDDVILDESHRVKSAGGKASMFATALRRRSNQRIGATGTPMPHSPLDIYAQYRFLDPGVFGTSKNRFQNRYAVMGGYEGREVKGWQNMEEFQQRFESIAFVVSSEEALPDLPGAFPPIERSFQLGGKALKVYVDLAKDFVSGVDGGLIVASNSLTRILRFRQITSGHVKDEAGNIHHLDNGREKLLEDLLRDEIPRGEPVVVFAAFTADLEAIQRVTEGLGLRYGELSGNRRDGLAADSTMAPDIDVLGCQIKSGGTGVDFTRSAYAVYYSIGYELGDYLQSRKRLDRPGQIHKVRFIHLIADNAPIDRVMLEALAERRDLVEAILSAARAHELS